MADKSIGDFKDAHFSRYGEFLVSYELSRRGWNVYNPVYDEYVDFVVSGFVCGKCRNMLRTVTPQLACPCGQPIPNAEKKQCISTAICANCGNIIQGKATNAKCRKCGGAAQGRERFLACFEKPGCERKGFDLREKRVSVRGAICAECGSENIQMIFRTVQVKSSRKEKNGTYAFNHRLRDLVPDIKKPDARHFFIWCAVDEDSDARPAFFVMSAQDFADTMKDDLMLPSFLKDDGREHFKLAESKWSKFEGKFDKMREHLEGDGG